MLPNAADCDECRPGGGSGMHASSKLIYSSLPFIATFFGVALFVFYKIFPALSGESTTKSLNVKKDAVAAGGGGRSPSLRSSSLLAVPSRPTIQQISALTFSATLASAAVLVELILCEISNTFSPAARTTALRTAITLLLFFLIIAIPFLEIHSVLSSAGYQFTNTGPSSSTSRSRWAWLIQLLSFGLWLFGLYWSGEYLLSSPAPTPAPVSSASYLVETTSERIGVIGISVMALLSGFASVSSPWQSFFARTKPVTEASVARKAAGLEASQDMLATKRSRLRALERKISDAPPESFLQKAMGSFRGNADSNERATLLLEISGLETMALSLASSKSALETRLAQQNRARTAQGRLILLLTSLFSLFCLYRIITTSITFIRRSLSSRRLTSEGFRTSDPVDNILALLTKHYNPSLDQAAWARQISFLLSGIILFASFSSVMQTFHLFSRFLPSLLKTIQANLALVVAQVCATYVISAALMLRVMMPGDVVGEGLKSLGGGQNNVSWIDGWFEKWFLSGVLLTAVGIWVGRKFSGNEDWDDDLDVEAGLEIGKMS